MCKLYRNAAGKDLLKTPPIEQQPDMSWPCVYRLARCHSALQYVSRALFSTTSKVSRSSEGDLGTSTDPFGFGSFSLSNEQREFQELALSFAKNKLLPFSAHWDRQHFFPVDTLREAAGLGFGGLYVAEDVGGIGLSRLDASVIFEALAYGDVPVTAYLSIHNMVANAIDKYGSDLQRREFVSPLASMDLLGSYCLTEPGSGSDAASLSTTARRKTGSTDYVLDGSKAFISGGGVSDIYLVMARTGGPGAAGISAFVVEKGMPGLSFGKRERKLGWNAQPTVTVQFDGVIVPETHLIGEEGKGFHIALSALDGGRINIGACSLGGAQFCLDTAMEYAKSRSQFGKPIASFQAIQFRIADMATALQASRLMVRHAASALDAQAAEKTLVAAAAKRFATDSCFQIANDALQLLGGYGYLQDYPIERVMRDLRVHSILEVSSVFSSALNSL